MPNDGSDLATAEAADAGQSTTTDATLLSQGADTTPAEKADQGQAETKAAAPETETKDGADKATKKDEKAADAKGDAPEYADFKMPDGFEADAERLAEFKTLAAELGLDQAGAQKAVDLYVKAQQEAGERIAQAQAEQFAETLKGWEADSRKDKEFGGDKLAENLGIAKAALEKFGGKGLTELLDKTGLGSHPEVIRFAFKVGKATADDTVINPGSGGGAPKTIEDVAAALFDKSLKD